MIMEKVVGTRETFSNGNMTTNKLNKSIRNNNLKQKLKDIFSGSFFIFFSDSTLLYCIYNYIINFLKIFVSSMLIIFEHFKISLFLVAEKMTRNNFFPSHHSMALTKKSSTLILRI